MKKQRIILIAEIGADTMAEAEDKLDAFREAARAILPESMADISLYRPDWGLPGKAVIALQDDEIVGLTDDGLLTLVSSYNGSPALFFGNPPHINLDRVCPAHGGKCSSGDAKKCETCKGDGSLDIEG